MDDMTISELAEMMVREFSRMYERFDGMDYRFNRVEKRLAHVEEVVEDHTGRFIAIEDRLSKVEYRLEGSERRLGKVENHLVHVEGGLRDVNHTLKDLLSFNLKKRVEKLEKKTFGTIQPA